MEIDYVKIETDHGALSFQITVLTKPDREGKVAAYCIHPGHDTADRMTGGDPALVLQFAAELADVALHQGAKLTEATARQIFGDRIAKGQYRR